MKTGINLQNLIQNLKLDYPEIIQLSDDADGYIRLIGYVILLISLAYKLFIILYNKI